MCVLLVPHPVRYLARTGRNPAGRPTGRAHLAGALVRGGSENANTQGLGRWLMPNATRWVSGMPWQACSRTSEWCTKTSGPPPSGAMKPKPLVPLNHLTVP